MTRFVLGDDQPKDNPWQHDRLGYAPFAKRIFEVILNHQAPKGYVIGINGQWGSGKSTILNFIKAYLQKHNQENPEKEVKLIEFQPWIVSGHQDLIVAFFKLLSEALGPNENRWVRAFRRFLRLSYGATDKLVDAAATVAFTVDPSAGAVSGFAGSLAKKSVDGYLGRFVEEKSLQQAYDQLRKQLHKSGKRFIVTIDDIDRLNDDEVRSIMQMVKTVGRLPNVVYLLAYDKNIVGRILDKVDIEGQPKFSEKIMQQEIALPPPSRISLLKLLDSQIEFLEGAVSNDDRWSELLRHGVHRWIRKPRDVLRLSNALKWTWPALEGEFDGSDLLVMEGIRLFEPVAYDWIQANRDFLFNEGDYILGDEAKKKANVATLKERLPAASVEPVASLLAILFPGQAKWFEGGFGYQESHIDSRNRRGMASPSHYDSYFASQISQDVIPEAVISQILSKDDPQVIASLLRPYLNRRSTDGTQMATVLTRELRFRLEAKNAASPDIALLDALFDVGEPIAAMPWPGGFEATPGGELSFLVKDILRKWGSDVADERLLEAFERCPSVAYAGEIYLVVGRGKGVIGEGGNGLEFIKDDTLRIMGESLLRRVRAAAVDGTLLNQLVLDGLVRAWKVIAGPEEPKNWMSATLSQDGRVAAKVARTVMSESVSTEGRTFRMYEKPDRELFDIQAMIDAARSFVNAPELTPDERAILREVLRAGPIVLNGVPTEKVD